MVIGNNAFDNSNISGMVLSGLSGIIYASIVIINKKIKIKIDSSIATFIQILSAAILLIPFVILEGKMGDILLLDAKEILFTVILGALHTGVAYALYFSTYNRMSSVEIVTYGYLEPIFGILLSVVFLTEDLSFTRILGGVIILGATYVGEYVKARKRVQDVLVLNEEH